MANKIFDNVEQWQIKITGVDGFGKTLVGSTAAITKEAFNACEFPIEDYEFKLVWKALIEKAKSADMSELKKVAIVSGGEN